MNAKKRANEDGHTPEGETFMSEQAGFIQHSSRDPGDSGVSFICMSVNRKWINEEFVDLSHICDREFVETMARMGHKVKSCKQIDTDGIDDTVIEFEIRNNRSDCCSVIGLAREAAAAFNRPMKCHEPLVMGCDTCSVYELLDVDVPAFEQCNRYTSRMIKNVRVAPSPKWLRHRLCINGIHPVNNIVDICNYVMLEYGQPLHAYDYRCISSGEIVVREAEDYETLAVSDSNLQQIQSGMLVVADGEHLIGLAGILCSADAQITEDTKMVVFEAGNFSSTSIRQTAQELNLQTCASEKFRNALDPMLTILAIHRACELVELLQCGDVLDGVIDILNYVPEPKTLELEPEKINQLLRTTLSRADMITYLKRLAICVEGNTILIPSFRPDLNSTADVAEEIGRLHGCNADSSNTSD